MGLFGFFKNKQGEINKNDEETTGPAFISSSYFDTDISEPELRVLINKAITIFQDNAGADQNQLIDAIKKHKDDENLAIALYRFIPIAWCRLFIPEPQYSDEYVLYKSESQQQFFSFSADNVYETVMQESKIRFTRDTSQEELLPILFHSADFQAINNALKGGAKLEDLVCAPSYFL